MKRRSNLAALLLIATTSLGVGTALADQLNGLQIKPVGKKVHIILDTDKVQPYRVERSSDTEYSIVLPKANLPEAFQGIGIPDIRNTEAGVVANIEELENGLKINLKNVNNEAAPYEIRFKAPATSSVSQKPTPSAQATSRTKVKPQVTRPKVAIDKPAVQLADAAPSPKAKLKTTPSSATSVQKPVSPSQNLSAQAPSAIRNQPVFSSEESESSKPSQKARVNPLSAKKPLQTAKGETAPEDGYALLNQPVEPVSPNTQNQEPITPLQKSDRTRPLSAEKVQDAPKPITPEGTAFERQLNEKRHGNTLGGSIMKWLLVASSIVGALILAVAGLAIVYRRTLKKPVLPVEPQVAGVEFFNPPQESPRHEHPETYEEDFDNETIDWGDEDPFSLNEPNPLATPPSVVDIPVKSVTTPQAITAKSSSQQLRPRHTQGLLMQPASSIADAVKQSLHSKANPYISAPFPLGQKKLDVTGGPKARKGKQSAPAQPKNKTRFNQYLSHQ